MKLNPTMLRLARESKGMLQSELADSIEITRAYVSKLEQEPMELNPETLSRISKLLEYPESFFYQEGETVAPNLSYRKRDKVPVRVLSAIEAHINIMRNNLDFLIRELSPGKPTLPSLQMEPERAANQLRKKWNIPSGMIFNLIKFVEENNIPVVSFDFQTERVDARSVFTDNGYPIIFLNSRMPSDRWRYSLAYEIGHLVMHLNGVNTFERDVTHEANIFAAELLMPEKEIRKDLKEHVTIELLAQLKRKWKVSMIALLYRAHNLEIITDNQKKYLLQQFNQLGIRRQEPKELDFPVEKPMLVKTWITTYKQKKRLSIKQLSETFHLTEEDFLSRYN